MNNLETEVTSEIYLQIHDHLNYVKLWWQQKLI